MRGDGEAESTDTPNENENIKLRNAADLAMMVFPTGVLPVKPNLRTSG